MTKVINLIFIYSVIQVFPFYLKVEGSYEAICKLKWHKSKKQLPLIYMAKFLSVPRPNIQHTHNFFILFTIIKHLITSSFILSVAPLPAQAFVIHQDTISWYQMHKTIQGKTQMLTQFKALVLDAEYSSWQWSFSHFISAQDTGSLQNGLLQNKHCMLFCFSLFFVKANLFGFLLVSKKQVLLWVFCKS